jgi:hypothetical protein
MHRMNLIFKVYALFFTVLVLSGCNVSEKEKSKIIGQNANAPTQTNFYIYDSTPTGVNENNRAAFPVSGVCSEPGNPIEVKFGPLVQTTTCKSDKTWAFSLNLTLVNDGTITFYAKEYRPNGSKPTDNHVAHKDSTDPVITGITTADDLTRANSKTFTWSCSETCTYRFSISSSPFPPSGAYSSTASYTDNIRDGVFYINIQAKDEAGNESAVLSKRYLIDTTIPSISGLANDGVAKQSKTWTWSCADAGGYGFGACETRFLVDQNPTRSPSGGYSGTTTTTQSSGDGTWYLHIQTIDDAGNESPVYHYSAVLDNTAPALASVNGMGSSPTIDTNNRTLTFTAPGDATHYQAVRARASLGSVAPPAGCNYATFDTNPTGGFTDEVVIGTSFDFIVDEGYDNYFCWITRDTLGNWETATRWVKLVANFPSGIILPMQGACPTGWTEFTAGRGRVLVGAGAGNNDGDGLPLTVRAFSASGGLQETSGIPANSNAADTQVPTTDFVYRAGIGYNLYADVASTNTLLDQQIASDTNMPPYYVVRFCRKN